MVQSVRGLKTENELFRIADRLLAALRGFYRRGQKLVAEVVGKDALVDRAMQLGGSYNSLYLAFMSRSV